MTATITERPAPVAADAMARARRGHMLARTGTASTAMALGMALGRIRLTLYADGTTGVALDRVRLLGCEVTAFVELDEYDTIARVTGYDTSRADRHLDVGYRQAAGHVALRAAQRARRHLRDITAAHARPRRVLPRARRP